MADYDWLLYDSAPFGDAVGYMELFQAAQGSTSTLTLGLTNMRGAGALPQNEQFTIEEIHLVPDHLLDQAESTNWMLLGYMEIVLNNKTVFQAPLAMLVSHAGFVGEFHEDTNTDLAMIGRAGMGYKLTIPIVVPGGTSFKVIIYQGTVVTADNTYVKCVLRGKLTTSGS